MASDLEAEPGQWLPLNRKGRFYTGTVLPVLVGSNDFAYLDRFLDLCGLPAAQPSPVQFLTEYSLVESVWTDDERARFSPPTEKDTPDVVLVGSDWLLVVEAKMFHRPSQRELSGQLDAQARVVRSMAEGLQLPSERVRHVALLPARYVARGIEWPVVRRETLLDTYCEVAPAYWTGVLGQALRRYPELASSSLDSAAHADSELTGLAIAQGHRTGTLPHQWIGREREWTGRPSERPGNRKVAHPALLGRHLRAGKPELVRRRRVRGEA